MNDRSWLEALNHVLEAAGVGPMQRSEILVETETFLTDADVGAFQHFGSPIDYGADLVAAMTEHADPPATAPGPSGADIADSIRLTTVSKAFRGRAVLRDLTFRVGQGQVTVLVGPNGVGKSTVLRILAGLERPDSGTVVVNGRVGYVPQAGGLDPYLKPVEHFALFGAAAGLDRGQAVLEGKRLADELAWDALAAPAVKDLSGGTRQKLNVITALLGRPGVLLLDEPYQGMDAESTRRFWELLWGWRDQGGSAVVSSHSPDALGRGSAVVELAEVSP